MLVEKRCEECGQPYSAIPSRARKRRFCSSHCAAVERTRRLQAEGRWTQPLKPRRGIETPCEMCGKPVYATERAREGGIGRFCSYACLSDSQRKEPVRKSCAYCGQAMALRPCYGAAIYCSQKCAGKGKTKRPLDWMHNGKPARKDKAGYVLLWEPDHPSKSYKGWVHEHRLVAEKMLGRYLEPGEECHHINGVKDDNRASNLVVLGKSDHGKETAANNWGRLNGLAGELEEYRKRFGPLD